MSLKEYFETTKGTGVLATSDKDGKVDAAIYARPHVMEDGSLVFIMREKLTHNNLKSNPHAAYLFIESGVTGHKGKRFFLTKIKEEENYELIQEIRRRTPNEKESKENELKFLVFFKIDKELPLIGSGE
ncbi:MAG: pyridoxamine 5'-phosphate oxidase family protein [Desulfobacterales bacterium]|nr:pyridoxamine 5'-phosphate oxidase family protein [Desulfobacterales bacterium]